MDSASTSASAVTAPAPLDDIDRRIVDALQRQGRMTFDELAGQVQLSASAVLRRVRRLEESGVIVGYSAIASTAFITRFNSTCWICTLSPVIKLSCAFNR